MYWSQLFALQDAIFYIAATSKCIALYISKIMLLFKLLIIDSITILGLGYNTVSTPMDHWNRNYVFCL